MESITESLKIPNGLSEACLSFDTLLLIARLVSPNFSIIINFVHKSDVLSDLIHQLK